MASAGRVVAMVPVSMAAVVASGMVAAVPPVPAVGAMPVVPAVGPVPVVPAVGVVPVVPPIGPVPVVPAVGVVVVAAGVRPYADRHPEPVPGVDRGGCIEVVGGDDRSCPGVVPGRDARDGVAWPYVHPDEVPAMGAVRAVPPVVAVGAMVLVAPVGMVSGGRVVAVVPVNMAAVVGSGMVAPVPAVPAVGPVPVVPAVGAMPVVPPIGPVPAVPAVGVVVVAAGVRPYADRHPEPVPGVDGGGCIEVVGGDDRSCPGVVPGGDARDGVAGPHVHPDEVPAMGAVRAVPPVVAVGAMVLVPPVGA